MGESNGRLVKTLEMPDCGAQIGQSNVPFSFSHYVSGLQCYCYYWKWHSMSNRVMGDLTTSVTIGEFAWRYA